MFWLLASIRPVHYLIGLAIVAGVAGGFYARKVLVEHGYKKGIEKARHSFADCIEKAVSPHDYQLCYDEVKNKEKQNRLVEAMNGNKPCVIKWHIDVIRPVALSAYHITARCTENRKEHGQVCYNEEEK